MPLINATWKVTHAGVILLDWDDYMQNEPSVTRAFVIDRFAALNDNSMRYIGREAVSHVATFSRVRVFDNDDDAREFMREHTVLLSFAVSDCLIEWLRRGVSDTLVDACITGYNARVENNHFMADYTLTGGMWLTSGFAPPPPPTETGTWRLISVTGPPAGVTLQVKNSSGVWEDVWTYTASS
jgi:hypothetical protein